MKPCSGSATPLIAALVVLSSMTHGCRSTQDVPYLGRWEGQFKVKRLIGKTQVATPSRNNWKGYILLYRTQDGELGNRCQSHLENEQEAVDLKGHWLVKRHQISVTFDNVKIDDAGGLDARDPNRAYLEPIEIQKAFSVPMVLTAGPSFQIFQGPLVEFGPLQGAFEFVKSKLPH
jgi:hypothetical protein